VETEEKAEHHEEHHDQFSELKKGLMKDVKNLDDSESDYEDLPRK
jgi:hypothetical protein